MCCSEFFSRSEFLRCHPLVALTHASISTNSECTMCKPRTDQLTFAFVRSAELVISRNCHILDLCHLCLLPADLVCWATEVCGAVLRNHNQGGTLNRPPSMLSLELSDYTV